MGIFSIIIWLCYGFVVGIFSKLLHPGDDPVGFLPTVGIGIVGSFVGGFVNYILGNGSSPLQSSGLIMGIIGGIIFLAIFRWIRLKYQGKSFWTGKHLY
jgi:uncharacterized membrane protein YeaQ/YmgE (transglycosylase-associated protein family)